MSKRNSLAQSAKKAAARDATARATVADQAKVKETSKTLDSFVNFTMQLGMGADNPMADSTYSYNPITRNRALLEWIHRGSWIGGVAVDVVADDMTRAKATIKGEIDPDDIQNIESEIERLDIWGKINENTKWSRLYGGSIAVLLIDGQDPSTPLRIETIRKDQFMGLLVLDRWMVEPTLEDVVQDYGADIGLPKFYRVNGMAPALQGKTIHYSRCIRQIGVKLPHYQALIENLWGLSELERLYDRLIAFDSASTGAAQLVYKSYLRTLKIKGLREVVAAGGDALAGLSAYVNGMRRYQGIEGMTMIDSEDDVASESHSAFSGLSDALTQFGQQLSGALQIPLIRLFGQSPSGFSTGDTDLQNYYDGINAKQNRDLRHGMTKVYKVVAASCGIVWPEGASLEFNSLWDLKDGEKATITQTVTNAVLQAEEAGIIDRATALKELRQMADITGVFSNITDDMVREAELEPPPLPEDVEVAQVRAGAQTQSAEIKKGEEPEQKELNPEIEP